MYTKQKTQYMINLIIIVGSVALYQESVFASALDLSKVKADLFTTFTKFIDDNIALFSLFISTAGVAIAQGDLRTRAQGAGIGFLTAMLIWTIAKKVVGIG